MPRTFEDFAVFAAPAVFVLLWSSGFVGAKLGLHYAEPLTYLLLRMIGVLILLVIIIALTRPKWPDTAGTLHSAATGLMVHGLYLGGVSSRSATGSPPVWPRCSSACSRC
jgi:drug/metabolite transporter (DMT)-like permease